MSWLLPVVLLTLLAVVELALAIFCVALGVAWLKSLGCTDLLLSVVSQTLSCFMALVVFFGIYQFAKGK